MDSPHHEIDPCNIGSGIKQLYHRLSSNETSKPDPTTHTAQSAPTELLD